MASAGCSGASSMRSGACIGAASGSCGRSTRGDTPGPITIRGRASMRLGARARGASTSGGAAGARGVNGIRTRTYSSASAGTAAASRSGRRLSQAQRRRKTSATWAVTRTRLTHASCGQCPSAAAGRQREGAMATTPLQRFPARLLARPRSMAMQEESDGSRPPRPTPAPAARQISCAMGGFGTGSGRNDGDLSWTNEALPLEVRRALLDKALEDFRTAKAAGSTRAGVAAMPDRPGQAGSDRDSTSNKDKPQA